MYSYARLHNCVNFSHILLLAWNAAIAKSNNESFYSSVKIFMARVEAILLSRFLFGVDIAKLEIMGFMVLTNSQNIEELILSKTKE